MAQGLTWQMFHLFQMLHVSALHAKFLWALVAFFAYCLTGMTPPHKLSCLSLLLVVSSKYPPNSEKIDSVNGGLVHAKAKVGEG